MYPETDPCIMIKVTITNESMALLYGITISNSGSEFMESTDIEMPFISIVFTGVFVTITPFTKILSENGSSGNNSLLKFNAGLSSEMDILSMVPKVYDTESVFL